MEFKSEMRSMNEKMLKQQEYFGVTLAGNEEFCQWAHTHGELEMIPPPDFAEEKTECRWSKEMDLIFGDRAEPIV